MTKPSNVSNQRLIVLSGPSGCGKATLLKYVTEQINITRVVTYTTRSPRPGEVNGEDYHFVSRREFDKLYEKGDLIEREQVYGDFFYGSPRDIFYGTDTDVIMELDTEGARNYRKIYRNMITIFIIPPSIEELNHRIQKRYPKEPNLQERLKAARPQLECANEYDYIVINDEIERVGQEVLGIIKSDGTDPEHPRKTALVAELLKSL